MYRKARIILAAVCFAGLTLLCAGCGGLFGGKLDFLPKLQLLPAVLALNAGALVFLLLLTLLFGRIYCSVLCPLGVFQDIFSRLRGKKRRFSYTPEKKWLRYGIFAVFTVSLLAGFQFLVLWLAPYSLYGRFIAAVTHRFAWQITAAAVGMAALIAVLAFLFGRNWCNTVCPVGTLLGLLSRFSLFKPRIDTDKCRNCTLCEKVCKARCIDIRRHRIDYSRCVDCFDCLDACRFGAMRYGLPVSLDAGAAKRKAGAPEKASKPRKATAEVDKGRRAFLLSSILASLAIGQAAARRRRHGLSIFDNGTEDRPDGRETGQSQGRGGADAGRKGGQAKGNGPYDNPGRDGSPGRKGGQAKGDGPYDNPGRDESPGRKGGQAKGDGPYDNPGRDEPPGRKGGQAKGDGADPAAARRNRLKRAPHGHQEEPPRRQPLTPPGAADDFHDRCTACQLCVASCPTGVLQPAIGFDHFMQPHLNYNRNFCEPDCRRCSEVCPTGAILPYLLAEKKSRRPGVAVIDTQRCLAYAEEKCCGSCARHCPENALTMRPGPAGGNGCRRPVVDPDRCIGCGSCEVHCVQQPMAAIYVERV